jgi:hypothetical protein
VEAVRVAVTGAPRRHVVQLEFRPVKLVELAPAVGSRISVKGEDSPGHPRRWLWVVLGVVLGGAAIGALVMSERHSRYPSSDVNVTYP